MADTGTPSSSTGDVTNDRSSCRRLVYAAALMGSSALATVPGSALAACVNTGGSNWNCSGYNLTGDAVAQDNAAVTAMAGFTVVSNDPFAPALAISGSGAISYTDGENAYLNGITGLQIISNGGAGGTPGSVTVSMTGSAVGLGSHGIEAVNNGTGALSITATSGITGSVHGISATNWGSDLTINAGQVYGYQAAIAATNLGTGSTSIHATGLLIAKTHGVFAINDSTTTANLAGDGLVVDVRNVSATDLGILVANSGAGATRILAEDVITSAKNSIGIFANNAIVARDDFWTNPVAAEGAGGLNANATDLEITAADVTGDSYGIHGTNWGTGDTIIHATGMVQSASGTGIFGMNFSAADDLEIRSMAVTGGKFGINAINRGTGETRVLAAGAVSGDTEGIYASGSGTDIVVQGTSVTGALDGISVYNFGTGSTDVSASSVVGTAQTGIFVRNGSDTTDLNIEVNDVRGGILGIQASNSGTGATSIRAVGTVTGDDEGGIDAMNSSYATDLTIDVADVNGDHYGIIAYNRGKGFTSITASGTISSSGDGLIAVNGPKTTANLAGDGLSIDVREVSGRGNGIAAANSGAGVTRVIAGSVSTSGPIGILATNAVVDAGEFVSDLASAIYGATANANATNIVIETGSASGGAFGIAALNRGTGLTSITATGRIETQNGTGIYASNDVTASHVMVDAVDVIGGEGGIVTYNGGAGATTITTRGMVEGSVTGVSAYSGLGGDIKLTNVAGGTVRNSSGVSSDNAISMEGATLTLKNDGDIVGTVALSGPVSLFENNGVWNGAGGTSSFGGGAGSELVNATGATVRGGADGAVAELTVLSDLPLFTTQGAVTLIDGGAGDVMRVSGASDFQTGSALSIDIGGAGGTDRFVSAGTILLTGTTLDINNVRVLAPGHYDVLTAEGGLTGTFSAITGMPALSAFVEVTNGYDANNAWLESVKYRDFADAGLTPNQIATGEGLDSIPPAGPLFTAVVTLATDAEARDAFDQLSGEIHASAKTAMLDDSRFIRDAMNDRLRESGNRMSRPAIPLMAYAPGDAIEGPDDTNESLLWGQAFASSGDWASDGNAASLDRRIGGLFFGSDAPISETWRVGVVAGYSRSSLGAADRNSTASSDNFHVGLYGGTNWGEVAFRTGAAYTWHKVSTSRVVAFSDFSDLLEADYMAGTAQVFGELAYELQAGNTTFEPFANLALVNVHTSPFTETGGAAALSSASSGSSAAFTTLGMRATTEFSMGEAAGKLTGMVGWRHALGGSPTAQMQFAGGDPFSIAGVPLAADAAVIEAGIDFRLSPSATLGASYGGQFGSGVSDHSFRASLRVGF